MKNEEIVIVSGISGAGKSATISCLEDIGYFCVDNLPVEFIPNLIETFLTSKNKITKIAFGVDIREHNLTVNFDEVIKVLKSKKYNFKVIFLDADDQVLLRRFSETRRKHPLSNDIKKSSLLDNILEEKSLLKKIKEKADRIIDTSNLNSQKLKELIKQIFLATDDSMIINLVSFGFKYGVPHDTDMLFDVRFLPNPYYDILLKPLTGNDEKIQDFVMDNEVSKVFLDKLIDLFDFLVPEFEKEGKSYLTVGIGCTGGKHRSVTIVNKLQEHFNSKNINVGVIHRDIIR